MSHAGQACPLCQTPVLSDKSCPRCRVVHGRLRARGAVIAAALLAFTPPAFAEDTTPGGATEELTPLPPPIPPVLPYGLPPEPEIPPEQGTQSDPMILPDLKFQRLDLSQIQTLDALLITLAQPNTQLVIFIHRPDAEILANSSRRYLIDAGLDPDRVSTSPAPNRPTTTLVPISAPDPSHKVTFQITSSDF